MSEEVEYKESTFDKVIAKIMPIADVMQNNLYISSITRGMMSTMPVLMASAFFQLVYSLPIPAWTNLMESLGVTGVLSTVVDICNLTGLFMVVAIAYNLGGRLGVDAFLSAIISLVSFLILTPIDTADLGGWQPDAVIKTSYIGAQGIFTAMIVSVVATSVYAYFIKKNIKLKLPESVPEFVSKSFEGVPASLLTLIPFVCLRAAFAATPWGSFTGFVYTMLQQPLTTMGNTFPAHLIATLVLCLLWWCGVHGTLVCLGVLSAVMTEATIANATAAGAGQPAPFLLSMMTFFLVNQFMGGPGCLFGLYVDLAFFTKSERYKAQGKISLIPGLFNIIEPTVFGLPIVLNPVLFAPFVIVPVIVYAAYYALASAGIIGVPVVNLTAMVLPGPIAGFILGGGIGLGIFVLAAMAFSVVAYLPFVKALDRQALKEEQAAAETIEA